MHAGFFIHYFKDHLTFPLLNTISKDKAGKDILLTEENSQSIKLESLSNHLNPSFIFFNSGRWIEEMETLRSYFPQAQFIYRTGGNEILKAPLDKGPRDHSKRQAYWVNVLNNTVDLLITNSEFTTARLQNMGISCPMTLCVGGVDTSLLKNTHDSGLMSAPIKMLCAARFVPYKNHTLLISLIHALRLRGHNIHLSLAGDGPLLEKIQEEVKIKELEKSITFLGPLSNQEVLKTLLESHIYIQLSTDYPTKVPEGVYLHSEGMGRSLLEAISAGVFVIAANSGAVSEIVSKERGILVNLDNFEDLILSIEPFLKNPPIRQNPTEIYSWKNLFKNYESLFLRLL